VLPHVNGGGFRSRLMVVAIRACAVDIYVVCRDAREFTPCRSARSHRIYGAMRIRAPEFGTVVIGKRIQRAAVPLGR